MAIPINQVPLYDMRQNQLQQDMVQQAAPEAQPQGIDYGALLKEIRKKQDEKTLLMAEIAKLQQNQILQNMQQLQGAPVSLPEGMDQ